MTAERKSDHLKSALKSYDMSYYSTRIPLCFLELEVGLSRYLCVPECAISNCIIVLLSRLTRRKYALCDGTCPLLTKRTCLGLEPVRCADSPGAGRTRGWTTTCDQETRQ